MTLERLKKPQMVVPLESVQQPKVRTVGKPTHAQKPATPAQLQRAKAKLEQDRSAIQLASEQASLDRDARAASVGQARVQRLQADTVAQEQKAAIQCAEEVQTKQRAFFSGFVKSPVQCKSLEGVKSSSVAASQARDQYQAAIVPEIVQRLVNDQMTVSIQAARASQQPNALNARADWFNTELPVLRAQHNHPNTPFADTASVFKPADQQAFSLGNTYKIQRLSHGLTPRDAASAILDIQRKADRDIALQGLLTGVNPRQSDHSSIQRLVAAGEHDLEVQRQALLEDAGIQSRALQLAKEQANPTNANSGISQKIKAKLGAGNPLPENVRYQLEAGLNVSLESVRVHTDSDADILAKSVNAIAFTTGKDIFFSSGSFEPNTKTGYELIAHEVTHTIQQASGQVKPGIDADSSLETAAQNKGAELASTFDPNFKYKNLENQAQPNSPLLSSQPPAHRAKLQAMQRSRLETSTTPRIGNLEGLQRSAPIFGNPTVQRSHDGTVIQRSWWNPFDWAKDAAKWLGDKFMDGLEWMGEKAAKAFMEIFAVAAKPFGETGKQVLEAIKSIGSNLLNVIKNPGQFAKNLIEGIKLGFGNFITNAPKHLTSVLGSFLGGKGLNLTFPTKLEPLPILLAFISSLNLGWESIKAKIAKQIGPKGPQALAAAEKAPGIVQTLSKGLHNTDEFTKEVLPTLKTEAVDGVKSAAQEGLIRAGIGVLLKLIPGAGTVLAIFDTVKVLIDRGKDLMGLASNVMGAFGAIAGGNLASAATAVENSLVSGIKVALDFIAKLAKIDTFIARVRDIIGRVTTKISSVVDPIIKKAVGFVKPFLDKLTGKPSYSTAVKPGSSTAIPAPSNLKANSSDPKNQNDTRTLEQKKQAVNDAEKAADGLLLEKEATPESVKAKLPALKQQYQLNSLELSNDKDDEYHITATINPTASTPRRTLKKKEHTEFYPEKVDVKPTTDGILVTYTTRAGKNFEVTVGKSGHPTQAQGFDLDLTTLGRGVTQDPANKEKNQGQNSAHVIANWFGGSGYKKSLNLIATSDHFNKVVMGRAEDTIVAWVKDKVIVKFDLKVEVDWGQVQEEAVIQQIIAQLNNLTTLSTTDAVKIKQRIIQQLSNFKQVLKAVENVEYTGKGTNLTSQAYTLPPQSTGKDKWL